MKKYTQIKPSLETFPTRINQSNCAVRSDRFFLRFCCLIHPPRLQKIIKPHFPIFPSHRPARGGIWEIRRDRWHDRHPQRPRPPDVGLGSPHPIHAHWTCPQLQELASRQVRTKRIKAPTWFHQASPDPVTPTQAV